MRLWLIVLLTTAAFCGMVLADDEEEEKERGSFLLVGGGWNHDSGMQPPVGMEYNDKFYAFGRLGGFFNPVAAFYFEPSYAILEAVPTDGIRAKTFEHFVILNPGISLRPPSWHRVYPRLDVGYDFIYHTIEAVRPNLQDHGFNARLALAVNPDVFLFEVSIGYLFSFTGGDHAVKLMQVGGGVGEVY